MLVANLGREPEVLYDNVMQPVVLTPGVCFPTTLFTGWRNRLPDAVRPVGTLPQLLAEKPTAQVYVVRHGGLGDVCMLIPPVRVLQARFPQARFTIASMIRGLLEADPTLAPDRGRPSITVDLTGYLELDHTGNPEFSHVSRLTLYGRALGIPMDPPVSWELPLLPADAAYADELVHTCAPPRIAVQVRGNAPHRSLGPRLLGPVLEALKARGTPILLDDDMHTQFPGIVSLGGRTTPRQAIAVLKRCQAALTMESGVFWLAHLAKVPTVCFFGPTRPSERILHHPLYPQGIKAVVLNELLDPCCPPCWGNGSTCDAWARKVARCMDEPDQNVVADRVTAALQVVME
jgi:hypothetical protein